MSRAVALAGILLVLRSGAIAGTGRGAPQVRWAWPNLRNGGIGFVALGFSQAMDPGTLTPDTVQLARRHPDGRYSLVPVTVAYNPGNHSVVITPTAPHPAGPYVVAVYGGARSRSGAALAGAPYYHSFSLANTFNAPGSSCSVTVLAPDGRQLLRTPAPCRCSGIVVETMPGVIVADQLRALDRRTVNQRTVELFRLNPDRSLGEPVPTAAHYDPEIPSIEVCLRAALRRGGYRLILHDVRDLAGNVMVQPFIADYTLSRDQRPYHVPPYGADVLDDIPIAVLNTFPHDGQSTDLSPSVSVWFNQRAVPESVNPGTVQLWRYRADGSGRLIGPLATSLTYNPELHEAILVAKQGLPEGNYLIVVNPGVRDAKGRTITKPEYFHYGLFAQDPPTQGGEMWVDGVQFASNPAPGSTVSQVPSGIEVFFNRYASIRPETVNATTVQLRPLTGSGALGSPIPATVTYNPWPGEAVIVPRRALTSGIYSIAVAGVVDQVGARQRTPFHSRFTIWLGARNTAMGD